MTDRLFVHINEDPPPTADQLRALVRQMQEMDEDIKALQDKKKKLIEDYVTEYNVPKKEVREAIKMLKSDIDPSVTQEIYKEVADLVSVR